MIPPIRSAFAALMMTGGLTALAGFFALLATWIRAVALAGSRGDWPMGQVIVAHGALWCVLGLMVLSPVVSSLFNGVIITAVLALGVMARLDVSRADKSAGSPPGQTQQALHFRERLSSTPRTPRRPGP